MVSRAIQAGRNRANRLIRRGLSGLLRPIPLDAWIRLRRDRLQGFFYHAVSPEAGLPHLSTYRYKTPEQFELDLIYLKERFRIASYEEILRAAREGKSFKEPTAFVSFDDGLRECWDHAAPLLRKHGIPCMFFVNNAFVGNQKLFYRHKAALLIHRIDRAQEQINLGPAASLIGRAVRTPLELRGWLYDAQFDAEPAIDELCRVYGIDWARYLAERKPYLSWEQIRDLRAQGFTIGAHTFDHRRLGLLSREEARSEIVRSCQDVAERLGLEQVPFAFPFSGQGVDRGMLRELVREGSPVELIFEATGLGRESDGIVNREWADPPGAIHGRSNLDELLKQAHIANLG